MSNKIERLLRLLVGLTEHHEIVGISHEVIAGCMELPIQVIQYDIRQQWRNHTSLWCADGSRLEHPIFHDSSSEKSFHQIQDFPIRHLRTHRRHDDRVRDIIEEPLNVRIEDNSIPRAV